MADRRQTGALDAVSPKVRPYLDIFPLPNGRDFGDGRAEFINSGSNVTIQDFYQARVDHNVSNSDSLFVRYTMDDSTLDALQAIPTWIQTDAVRSQYVTIEEKKILSPTLLNVFRFGFNRTRAAYIQTALDSRVMDPALWFIPGSDTPGIGSLGGGVGSIGGARNRPKTRSDTVFQPNDTLTYNRGAQSLKFGGEVQRIQTNENDTTRGQGLWTFSHLRNLLLNVPTSFRGLAPGSDFRRGWRQTLLGLFVQDDVRVRSNLTLNMGVRWEFVTNPNEVNGKSAHFNDVTVKTKSILGNPIMKLKKDNIAPRFGFAWDPFGTGKTSIRGGAGLFHQMIFRNYYNASRQVPAPWMRIIGAEGANISFPRPLEGLTSDLSDFVMEAYDLPNGTVFDTASGAPSRTAGRITSTATSSRQIQLGLKFVF